MKIDNNMKAIPMESIRNVYRGLKHIEQTIRHTDPKYRRVLDYLDDNKQPVFKEDKPLPTLIAEGTVKLHGTNASIVFDGENIYPQSRRNLISIDNDNYGFARFVKDREEELKKLLESLHLGLKGINTVLYGEFVGKGIQSKVAVSELERSFFIYGVKYYNCIEDTYNWSMDIVKTLTLDIKDVYICNDYLNLKVPIDLNDPDSFIELSKAITDQIDTQCPVGTYLGIDGHGEGIVWNVELPNSEVVFLKDKGLSHKNTKSRKKDKENVEITEDIKEFVEYSLTDNRVKQAISEVCIDTKPEKKHTGDIIKWCVMDIFKEELDVIEKNKLDVKYVKILLGREAASKYLNILSEQP